jgi:hypothetical protein
VLLPFLKNNTDLTEMERDSQEAAQVLGSTKLHVLCCHPRAASQGLRMSRVNPTALVVITSRLPISAIAEPAYLWVGRPSVFSAASILHLVFLPLTASRHLPTEQS